MSLAILAGVGIALYSQIPKERTVPSPPRVDRPDHHQRDHEAAAEAIVKRLKAERGTNEAKTPPTN